MHGDDQGAKVFLAEVLDLVHEDGNARVRRARRTPDGDEEFRQVDLQVAAIGAQ